MVLQSNAYGLTTAVTTVQQHYRGQRVDGEQQPELRGIQAIIGGQGRGNRSGGCEKVTFLVLESDGYSVTE
jgi:hypothetical protein